MKQKKKKQENKWVKCCYGISSKADEKHGHVFMIDYDNVALDVVEVHLRQLQKTFGFSDFFIIESTHGFNAICLDIVSIGLIYSIGMSVESPADRDFFVYGFNRGYYTLRFDCDKILVKVLKNNSKKFEKSLCHKLFLEWYFDIYIDSDYRFNNVTSLKIIQYPSNKNGYHYVNKQLPSYLVGLKV